MRTSLKSWTKGIKGRLLVTAIFPFLAFAVIFGFTYNGLNTLSAMLQSAHHDIIPNLAALDDIRIAQNRFGYRMWEGIVNPEDRKETLPECIESLTTFKEALKKYQDNPFTPDETVLFNEVKDTFPAYLSLAESIVADMKTETPESVKRAQENLDSKLHPLNIKLEEFNEKVTALYQKRAASESVTFHSTKERILTMTVLVTLCAGFSIMGLLLLTARKVSGSVGTIAEQLTLASEQVAGAVVQLNQAGNGLSESSTQAAASLEETAASLEELSSMVKMNSDNASQAATLAHTSRDSAEQGEKEIKNLIQAMLDISDSSKKIEEIISVIDDIAFQTNLLALNAAVEAARAGEQGKGFAVVAEAVRALAQRSASSAKDISDLIKNSVERVAQGSKIADTSGAVLGKIVESIKQVSELNNKIATASTEQTSGLQQISKAMNSLDQSAQANAASAEEIAATSGEINNLAQTSESLAKDLTAVVLGGREVHRAADTHIVPMKKETTRVGNRAA